jgi:hypothetical protein
MHFLCRFYMQIIYKLSLLYRKHGLLTQRPGFESRLMKKFLVKKRAHILVIYLHILIFIHKIIIIIIEINKQ